MASKPQIVTNTVKSVENISLFIDKILNEPTLHSESNNPKQCVERKGRINKDLQYAWVWDTSKLITISTRRVAKIGSWTFGALLKETRTKITCVIDLEGLENNQNLACVGLSYRESQGMVCIMAAASSMIWGAISLPREVNCLCVVDSGASSGQCNPLHPELQQSSGLIAVGLSGGCVILLDLRRNEVEAWPGKEEVSPAEIVTVNQWGNPEHVAAARKKAGNIRGHLVFLLHEPSQDEICEVTSLLYAPQICSLIMGFSSGEFQMWNLNTMTLEVKSERRMQPITQLLLLQPENDPRNMCYLWVVESGDFHSRGSNKFCVGRLYALVYDTKEVIESYGTLYQDLVSMTAVFIFEMSSNSTSMRGSRCLSLHHLDSANRNMDPVDVDDTGGCSTSNSLCTFTWEVWDATAMNYGYWFAVFDLNLWYNNEMPSTSTLRGHARECNYMICSSLSQLDTHPITNSILDSKVLRSTVQRYTSIVNPEEASHPSALTFDVVCLLGEDIAMVHHPGVQKHLLMHFEKYLAPEELMSPDNLFMECIQAGLRPYGHDHIQATSSHEEKLRMLLSIALEQGYIKFLQNCARTWAGGNYSFGGCTLSVLMDWAWKQTEAIKSLSEQLVIPLFDGGGQILDIKSYLLLKRCCTQFETLRTLFSYILESNLLPMSEVAEEMVQRTQVLALMKLYTDVVLWAYDMGLLPENGQPGNLNHPNIPYPLEEFTQAYKKRRESVGSGKLMIDCLMDKCGSKLKEVWQREGGVGTYPPPTVRALLLTYLLATVPTDLKHCLVIYFFFDLAAHHAQNQELAPQITHIVHFPSSFELRPSLIKLMQAVWHLDHDGVDTSMVMLQSSMISDDDVVPWRDQILQLLMKMGHKQKALSFIRNRHTCVSSYEAMKFEMCLLLDNKFLDEALYHQRTIRTVKLQQDLLATFLSKCYEVGLMKNLLTLALDPVEEEAVVDFLETRDKSLAVMYLLMKNRFIEAYQLRESKEVNASVRKVLQMYNENLPQITQDLAKLCHTMPRDFCGWGSYDPMTARRPLSTHVTVKSPCTSKVQTRSTALFDVIFGMCGARQRSSVDSPVRETSKRKLAADLPLSNSYNYLIPHVVSAMEIPRELTCGNETPAKRMRLAADSPGNSMTQVTEISSREALFMLMSPHIKRRQSTSYTMDLDTSSVPSPQSILKVRQTPKETDSAERQQFLKSASDVYVFRATSSQASSASPKQLRFNINEDDVEQASTSAFTPNTSKYIRSGSRGRVKSRRTWVTPQSSMSLRSQTKAREAPAKPNDKVVTETKFSSANFDTTLNETGEMELTKCEKEMSSDDDEVQSIAISEQSEALWDNIMAIAKPQAQGVRVTHESDTSDGMAEHEVRKTKTVEIADVEMDESEDEEIEDIVEEKDTEMTKTEVINRKEEDVEEAQVVQKSAVKETETVEMEEIYIDESDEEQIDENVKMCAVLETETEEAEPNTKMCEEDESSSESVLEDEESFQFLKYEEESSDEDVIGKQFEKEFQMLDEIEKAQNRPEEDVIDLSDQEDDKESLQPDDELAAVEESCSSVKSSPDNKDDTSVYFDEGSSSSSIGLPKNTMSPDTFEKYFGHIASKPEAKVVGSETTPTLESNTDVENKTPGESPEVLEVTEEHRTTTKSPSTPEFSGKTKYSNKSSPEVLEVIEGSPRLSPTTSKFSEKYSEKSSPEGFEEKNNPEICLKAFEESSEYSPSSSIGTKVFSSIEKRISPERDIVIESPEPSTSFSSDISSRTPETYLPPKYKFPGIFDKRQSPSSFRTSPDVCPTRHHSPHQEQRTRFGMSPRAESSSRIRTAETREDQSRPANMELIMQENVTNVQQSAISDSTNLSIAQESINQSTSVESVKILAEKSIHQSPGQKSMDQSENSKFLTESIGDAEQNSEVIAELGDFIRRRLKTPDLTPTIAIPCKTEPTEIKIISQAKTQQIETEIGNLAPSEILTSPSSAEIVPEKVETLSSTPRRTESSERSPEIEHVTAEPSTPKVRTERSKISEKVTPEIAIVFVEKDESAEIRTAIISKNTSEMEVEKEGEIVKEVEPSVLETRTMRNKSSENTAQIPEKFPTAIQNPEPSMPRQRSIGPDKEIRSMEIDDEAMVTESIPTKKSTRQQSEDKTPVTVAKAARKRPEFGLSTPVRRSTRSASSESAGKSPVMVHKSEQNEAETRHSTPTPQSKRSRSPDKVDTIPEMDSKTDHRTQRSTRSKSTEIFRRTPVVKTELVVVEVTTPKMRASTSSGTASRPVQITPTKDTEDETTEEEEEVSAKSKLFHDASDMNIDTELKNRRLTRHQMSLMKRSQSLLGKSNYNDLTETENVLDSPRRSVRSQKANTMSVTSSHKGRRVSSVCSGDSNDSSRYVTRSMAARINSIQEFVSLPNTSPRRRTQSSVLVDSEEKRVTRSQQRSPSGSVASSMVEDFSDGEESVTSRSSMGSKRRLPVAGSRAKKKSKLQQIVEMPSKEEEDVSKTKGETERLSPHKTHEGEMKAKSKKVRAKKVETATQEPGVSFEFSVPPVVSSPEKLSHSNEDRVFEFSPPVQKKKLLPKFIDNKHTEDESAERKPEAAASSGPSRKPATKKQPTRLTRFSVARKKSTQ